MAQEEKQLLLKDLSARLSYGVILLSQNGKVTYQTDGNTAAELLVEEGWKPYLRPMSSMTEEEESTLSLCNAFTEMRSIELKIDFLNQQHLDYRGLIEKGLAIAVTKDNNPYE